MPQDLSVNTPQASKRTFSSISNSSTPTHRLSPSASSIGSAQSGTSSYFESAWKPESRSGASSAVTSVASSVAFVPLDPFGSFIAGPPTAVIPQLSTQNVPDSGPLPPRRPALPSRPSVLSDATPLVTTPVPEAQRQHPRRTARRAATTTAVPSVESSAAPPPPPATVAPPATLQRQADRKVNFVENLVDSAAQIVETIWHPPRNRPAPPQKEGILPLRTFIQETLRRSRTSYSTLQVALYYLIVIRPHLPGQDADVVGLDEKALDVVRAKQCGRRMFLAALILASKYLQDRNYSARAWSKISGLATNEINVNEMAFLEAIDWKLHISEIVFQRWTDLVLKYTSAPSPSPVSPTRTSPWKDDDGRKQEWCDLVLHLSPDLHEVDEILGTSTPAPPPPAPSPPLLPPPMKRAMSTVAPQISSPFAVPSSPSPAPPRRPIVPRKSNLSTASSSSAASPGMITISYPSPSLAMLHSPRQEAAWTLNLLRHSATPSPGMGRKRSCPGSTGVTPRLRGLMGSPILEGERKRRCGWGEFGVAGEGVAQGVR